MTKKEVIELRALASQVETLSKNPKVKAYLEAKEAETKFGRISSTELANLGLYEAPKVELTPIGVRNLLTGGKLLKSGQTPFEIEDLLYEGGGCFFVENGDFSVEQISDGYYGEDEKEVILKFEVNGQISHFKVVVHVPSWGSDYRLGPIVQVRPTDKVIRVYE